MSQLLAPTHEATTAQVVAIGDIHGARKELLATLRSIRLVDESERWIGGERTLWFLGDYMDRGPDGAGVVHLIRSLAHQAAQEGGGVHALLGNHEVLALGQHHFPELRLDTPWGQRCFSDSWRRNGGRTTDQSRLSEDDFQWLAELPAMAVEPATQEGGLSHLLIHADTTEYSYWGRDVQSVNAGIAAELSSGDPIQMWNVWARMTTRASFRKRPMIAARFLARFGADRLVHGHSIIGEVHDFPLEQTEGPDVYARGRVVDIDGGLYDGGPCLVLPLN